MQVLTTARNDIGSSRLRLACKCSPGRAHAPLLCRYGAHYLREANKPEVQRTELNRIELSMPKKLVDTVMTLVNANLKSLLGNRAQTFGLTMLRHVAVANQLQGRREFSAVHVAHALMLEQVCRVASGCVGLRRVASGCLDWPRMTFDDH